MFSGVPPITDMAARLRSTPPRKRRHRGLARPLVALRVSYLLTAASRRLSRPIEKAAYIITPESDLDDDA
jgi:hypothetical protein